MKYFTEANAGIFELPDGEFYLHKALEIKGKIIAWFKKNYYSQGDGYWVRITKKGKWEVSYSNDYPMQHGSGKSYILTEKDFVEAMKYKCDSLCEPLIKERR